MSPALAEKLPGEQAVQNAAPLPEELPALQAVQLAEPEPLNVPKPHVRHPAEDVTPVNGW